LEQFDSVTLVAFSWVAGLIVLYVLLIGPGDYFFLKKVVRWMPATWITFPTLLVAFVAIAALLNANLKEDRIRVNQVDVVDVDSESRFARGTTWAHVFSPETRAYDFSLQVTSPEISPQAEVLLSWQGLPGRGLGGMSSAVRATTFADPYTIRRTGAETTEIVAAPISVASTKSFVGRWHGRMEIPETSSLVVTPDGLLRGEVMNPLSVPLTDCMVLYENWLYRLNRTQGRLAIGQSTLIQREQPVNLEWRLMRRQVSDTAAVQTPWDPASEDVPRILEMMLFYEAAGGAGYTQLSHRYQDFIDVSRHLRSGFAVLWGRATEPAATLLIDGSAEAARYDRRWTMYRVLLPVRAAAKKTTSSRTSETR
jgi:hypothetical protein